MLPMIETTATRTNQTPAIAATAIAKGASTGKKMMEQISSMSGILMSSQNWIERSTYDTIS
jgi:hypothetical protein